jgi:hypothetical protein
MPITHHREMPRENSFRLGESRELTRRFVVTHDGTPPTGAELASTLQVDVGVVHPEYLGNYVLSIDYKENYEDSQYHGEVVVKYGIADLEQLAAPVLRPPIWTFSTQGTTVPALYYYEGSGNGNLQPLTNSAYDYFTGLTTSEAQCKIVIKQNLATFPNALAIALTNTINSSPWIGSPAYCWKCEGISGELKFEEYGAQIHRFWEVTIELLYRQTGWVLQLPDVGFNYLAGGVKRRAMVFDFQNAEWVASAGPVGLDGSGNQTLGAPAIIQRRVHREANFNAYFGSPPP